MKKNLKKIFQNRIFIFLLGGIIFSGVSVYAVTYFPSNQVTYDNKTSGLESSDVQGAIDELYNTCSQIVSSGNNLYYIESGSLINKYNIIKMNANTGKTTTIASDLSGISNLIVSGDNLYYKEVASFNEYNIIKIDINTGKTTTIASDLSDISNLVAD